MTKENLKTIIKKCLKNELSKKQYKKTKKKILKQLKLGKEKKALKFLIKKIKLYGDDCSQALTTLKKMKKEATDNRYKPFKYMEKYGKDYNPKQENNNIYTYFVEFIVELEIEPTEEKEMFERNLEDYIFDESNNEVRDKIVDWDIEDYGEILPGRIHIFVKVNSTIKDYDEFGDFIKKRISDIRGIYLYGIEKFYIYNNFEQYERALER